MVDKMAGADTNASLPVTPSNRMRGGRSLRKQGQAARAALAPGQTSARPPGKRPGGPGLTLGYNYSPPELNGASKGGFATSARRA